MKRTRRRVVLKTFQNRETKIIKVRYLAYEGRPETLLDLAQRIYPGWQPIEVSACLSYDTSQPPQLAPPASPHTVTISFGTDAEGVNTTVSIELHEDDVRPAMRYLASRCGVQLGYYRWKPPLETDTDDDGGEELEVPTISEAMLAEMQAVGAVQ